MEEDGQHQYVGIAHAFEYLRKDRGQGHGLFVQPGKGFQGAQGMFVHGKAVKVLVAHDSAYGLEFREVRLEQARSGGLAQGKTRLQGMMADGHEILADDVVLPEFIIHEMQVAAQPVGRGETQGLCPSSAFPDHLHEPRRVFREPVPVRGVHAKLLLVHAVFRGPAGCWSRNRMNEGCSQMRAAIWRKRRTPQAAL